MSTTHDWIFASDAAQRPSNGTGGTTQGRTTADAWQGLRTAENGSGHQLGWVPGYPGKGYVTNDGVMHTWRTQHGAPHHPDYMFGLMNDTFNVDQYNKTRELTHPFVIYGDGTYQYTLDQEDGKPAPTVHPHNIDPRLSISPLEGEWRFGGIEDGDSRQHADMLHDHPIGAVEIFQAKPEDAEEWSEDGTLFRVGPHWYDSVDGDLVPGHHKVTMPDRDPHVQVGNDTALTAKLAWDFNNWQNPEPEWNVQVHDEATGALDPDLVTKGSRPILYFPKQGIAHIGAPDRYHADLYRHLGIGYTGSEHGRAFINDHTIGSYENTPRSLMEAAAQKLNEHEGHNLWHVPADENDGFTFGKTTRVANGHVEENGRENVTVYATVEEMKTAPRRYTGKQAEMIREAVKNRKPLGPTPRLDESDTWSDWVFGDTPSAQETREREREDGRALQDRHGADEDGRTIGQEHEGNGSTQDGEGREDGRGKKVGRDDRPRVPDDAGRSDEAMERESSIADEWWLEGQDSDTAHDRPDITAGNTLSNLTPHATPQTPTNTDFSPTPLVSLPAEPDSGAYEEGHITPLTSSLASFLATLTPSDDDLVLGPGLDIAEPYNASVSLSSAGQEGQRYLAQLIQDGKDHTIPSLAQHMASVKAGMDTQGLTAGAGHDSRPSFREFPTVDNSWYAIDSPDGQLPTDYDNGQWDLGTPREPTMASGGRGWEPKVASPWDDYGTWTNPQVSEPTENSRWYYHGSPVKNRESILAEGLRAPQSGLMSRDEWFGDPEYPDNYVDPDHPDADSNLDLELYAGDHPDTAHGFMGGSPHDVWKFQAPEMGFHDRMEYGDAYVMQHDVPAHRIVPHLLWENNPSNPESQGTPQRKGRRIVANEWTVIPGVAKDWTESEYRDEDSDHWPLLFDHGAKKIYIGNPGTHHADLMHDHPDAPYPWHEGGEPDEDAYGLLYPHNRLGDLQYDGPSTPGIKEALKDHLGVRVMEDPWKFGKIANEFSYRSEIGDDPDRMTGPWEPGFPGKGFLAADDTLHHWKIDEDDAPHHMVGIAAKGYDPKDVARYLYINPDGSYDAHESNGSPWAGGRFDHVIEEHDPRLKRDGGAIFGKTASENLKWNPGNTGKGFAAGGKLYTWNTSGNKPHHYDMWNHFKQSEPDIPIMNAAFAINHQGYVEPEYGDPADYEQHLWQDQRLKTDNSGWKFGIRSPSSPPFEEDSDLPGWAHGVEAMDFPEGGLYHMAPAADRKRILQHGLQPSQPYHNPRWNDPRQQVPAGQWLREQPTGVYGVKHLDDTETWDDFDQQPYDRWFIPEEQIQSVVPDNAGSAWVVPHVVHPELDNRAEYDDDKHWKGWPEDWHQHPINVMSAWRFSNVNWKPGLYGRGLIDNGVVHTWNDPTGHVEYAARNRLDEPDYSTAVYIKPDGAVTGAGREIDLDTLRQFPQAQPGLFVDPDEERYQAGDYRLGSLQALVPPVQRSRLTTEARPWQRGFEGKGFIYKGQPYLWKTDKQWGSDPHHPDALMSLDPEYANGGNGLGIVDRTEGLFTIDKDGKVNQSDLWRMGDPAAFAASHPDLYHEEDDWKFGTMFRDPKARPENAWNVVQSDFDPGETFYSEAQGNPGRMHQRVVVGHPNTNEVFVGQPGTHHGDLIHHHGLDFETISKLPREERQYYEPVEESPYTWTSDEGPTDFNGLLHYGWITDKGGYGHVGAKPGGLTEALHAQGLLQNPDGSVFTDLNNPDQGNWTFGKVADSYEDEEEPFDEDQWIADEGWLTPTPKEPLVNHVNHPKNWGEHYDVSDDDEDYDEGGEHYDPNGQQNERPIIFDGSQFHVGEPNSYHWDLIENTPGLRERFESGRGGAPQGNETVAQGRWNPATNDLSWYNKGRYRRDHFKDLSERAFPNHYDESEDMGLNGGGESWVFGAAQFAGNPEDFDPGVAGQHPVVYYPDEDKLVIGHEGLHHADIGYDGNGYPGVISKENNPAWKEYPKDTIGWVNENPSNHEDLARRISEHMGHPFTTDLTEGFTFGKTANKLEWLESRPDKAMNTPEGKQFFQLLKDKFWNEKTDPLFPWLWREYKKRHIWPAGGTNVHYGNDDGGIIGYLSPGIVNHWADWFASGNRNPTRRGVDLMQMSVQAMEAKMREWQEHIEQQEVEDGANGGKVLYQLPNGWTIRELGPEDLAYEGNVMGHCVGGHGYDEAVRNGHVSIISLRDEKGQPHATMELKDNGRGPEVIEQVQGKSNVRPKPEYQAMLKQWILSLPENARPVWKDSEEEYSDIRQITDPDDEEDPHGWGGYEPHGDYGVPLPHKPTDYDSVLHDIHEAGGRSYRGNGYYDPAHGEALYEHALGRNEIPQLAEAYQKYNDDIAHPAQQNAEENNMDWLQYPGDYSDQPEFWDSIGKEEGITGKEAYDQAYDNYSEAHSELMENVPQFQASGHIGDLLSRHYNPETNGFENPQPKPTVFSSWNIG